MAMRSGLAGQYGAYWRTNFHESRAHPGAFQRPAALFSLCQGFEPISDFVEPFVTGRARASTGGSVGIFVRLAGNSGHVIGGATDRSPAAGSPALQDIPNGRARGRSRLPPLSGKRLRRRYNLRHQPFARNTDSGDLPGSHRQRQL